MAKAASMDKPSVKYEALIREIFTAWETRDWSFVDGILADDFTFTSLYDDHIQRGEYKRKCWDSVQEIAPYTFMSIVEQGDDAFIWYRGHINGVNVQNVEHFHFRDGKLTAVDVFFGRPEDASSR